MRTDGFGHVYTVRYMALVQMDNTSDRILT